MAHQSLYRKYRPSTFDAVVGQGHIERTLRNAVTEGKVAHAYLFTGPRGTGKTTTARLLAKALLCERGPTGEPDGTCPQCLEVAEGNHPDVFELDAASHTQVEVVRDQIIGRVQFAPTRGRYKVYIIDEVHMLSSSSFNALLKTLEEPPPHVVFVMCTTHPHKVPETIHSRCQRFDFHRISVEEIADHLRFIAESEGLKVDRGAYTLIARHAGGGMRDAITSLEQLAAFTGGEITVDDVEGMLGEVDTAQLFAVAALIARRDIAGCFRWIGETVETGTDLAELVRELTAHMRDLYLIAAAGEAGGFVDRTAADIAALEAQAAEFGGPDRLARALDLLGELGSELRWSSDPRLSIEITLTRMAHPQGEMTLAALAERVEMLERGMRLGAPAASSGGPATAPPAEDRRGPATAPPAERGSRGVSTGGAGGDAPRERSSAGAVAGPAAGAADVGEDAAPDSLRRETQVFAEAEAVPEPEPCPEPVIAASLPPGTLDRGTAKRNWQAVLAEVRKRKPAREATFAQVEVDVDADGETLVLEFPAEPTFAFDMASEPANRELLRDSLAAVFGAAPPFRFQRGRGAVRPEPAPEQEPVVASAPAAVSVAASDPTPDPSPAPVAAEATAEPVAASDDIEHMLLHELGGSIVAEHEAQTDGEDEK